MFAASFVGDEIRLAYRWPATRSVALLPIIKVKITFANANRVPSFFSVRSCLWINIQGVFKIRIEIGVRLVNSFPKSLKI